MFEVAAKADPKLLAEAIQIAHVVKYADQFSPENVMSAYTATLVEIHTLGAHGLTYRHRLGGKLTGWMHLGAIRAPRLADTCGFGTT
jgi:hypothetical protein